MVQGNQQKPGSAQQGTTALIQKGGAQKVHEEDEFEDFDDHGKHRAFDLSCLYGLELTHGQLHF